MIILDLIMPGLDGGQTLDGIRAITTDVPVILSSGYSAEGQVNEVMQKGCSGFMHKPFSVAEVSRILEKVLNSNAG